MNELPKIVRARLNTAQAGDHPDPDLLAAFAEQVLPKRERAQVLLHLSRCTDCRDVLALAVPPAASASASLDTAGRVSWFHWPILRWGAVAACVVIVGSAVLMKRDMMMTRSAKQVAIRSDAESDRLVYKYGAEVPKAAPSPPPHDQAPMSTGDEPVKTKLAAPAQKKIPEQILARKLPVAEPAPSASENKVGGGVGGGRVQGAVVGGSAKGGAQGFRIAPGAPPKEEGKSIPLESRDQTNQTVVPQAMQTVEVQAAAAPIVETDSTVRADSHDKHDMLGKAKPPANAGMFDRPAGPPASVSVTASNAAVEVVAKTRERNASAHAPVSRWTISSGGQLQHSVDSGRTWQPVTVAEGATFRALSANGPDLWVGGASGMLYHSTDSGGHWTQVKPASVDANLTADIAAIEFTDVRQGKITTANGEVWLTDDGGQSWRKGP